MSDMTPQQIERDFAAAFKQWRELRGMSQTELAHKASEVGLPFHQQTVARIESGERPVRVPEAVLLSAVLGVRLVDLVHQLSSVERSALDQLAEARAALEETVKRMVSLEMALLRVEGEG
ncbi:helix-turn-helix domain-containing protein [Nocardia abscessus]|uniref:helix-turn-helix domain-containing protein n=1 Tax=Nocardia abscessus TaxID=120957 RepID=UPI00245910BA|nr:helix-turn-helix transcriptional regulator [Nocardia abscessus]